MRWDCGEEVAACSACEAAGGPIVRKSALSTSQEAFVTLSTIDPKSPSLGLLLKVQDSSKTEAGAILVEYDAGGQQAAPLGDTAGCKSWTLYLIGAPHAFGALFCAMRHGATR